jgi:hypothetical protein
MTEDAAPAVVGKLVCDRIAASLVEFGYPGVTGQQVADLLVKPEEERGIIGMMAAGMLEDNGITNWTVDYS